MEHGGISDFPIETYRLLPHESKKFLKFIYSNLVLVQKAILEKGPGSGKGTTGDGPVKMRSKESE
ncbi:hypothetical protein AGMMS49579_19950 [Spirochaetia bacterium]|nr:hypothetical protein AGMMS49579_19950 [Spirochaetia bacterium]